MATDIMGNITRTNPMGPDFTGKSMSEALIFASINPKYSIPLLGRFTLIIHQISISRTLVERH